MLIWKTNHDHSALWDMAPRPRGRGGVRGHHNGGGRQGKKGEHGTDTGRVCGDDVAQGRLYCVWIGCVYLLGRIGKRFERIFLIVNGVEAGLCVACLAVAVWVASIDTACPINLYETLEVDPNRCEEGLGSPLLKRARSISISSGSECAVCHIERRGPRTKRRMDIEDS